MTSGKQLLILGPLLALLLLGCAKPVKPTIVATTASTPDAVNAAVRVLSQHGLTVARVDEAAGVVVTDWQATDFRYGQGPNGRDAFIVRRFTTTVSPRQGGSQVFVTVEDMKCEEPGLFVSGESGVHVGCVRVDGVVPPDQTKVDAIGVDLDRELP